MEVTVHKAKTQLSALLKLAECGEEVVIRRGKYGTGFRLTPLRENEPRRVMESSPEWKDAVFYSDEAIWESEWEEA
ncbi:MAG: type II toxin-antitoxin system prevent-host-death family antitoxin [Kiritimatiellae bacterium]|jgi:antitoxin (DNA-binding transcriptional repressor) of toxin-antitoxin stability system|nr:type II toxin-antitoxin system prevent-host-death family antitoxin [Kiritimatiellia bacterium]